MSWGTVADWLIVGITGATGVLALLVFLATRRVQIYPDAVPTLDGMLRFTVKNSEPFDCVIEEVAIARPARWAIGADYMSDQHGSVIYTRPTKPVWRPGFRVRSGATYSFDGKAAPLSGDGASPRVSVVITMKVAVSSPTERRTTFTIIRTLAAIKSQSTDKTASQP